MLKAKLADLKPEIRELVRGKRRPGMAREPNWGTVWLEARAAGRNPVAALVAAGRCTAAEVALSETAGPSRPPPGELLPRRLKCHEGLDPEQSAPVVRVRPASPSAPAGDGPSG